MAKSSMMLGLLRAATMAAAICSTAFGAPDTLVVCPDDFRPALVEWQAYRQTQGHELAVIAPPADSTLLRSAIRGVAKSGQLKFLVLMGDVPSRTSQSHNFYHANAPRGIPPQTVPTNYLPARVNLRWSSDRLIATDVPYADVDSDGTPDVAIGRIPADDADELGRMLRKIMRYEQQSEHGDWERRLHFASGHGGFGVVTDTIITAAARQVIQQSVPTEYQTAHIFPGATDSAGRLLVNFAAAAREQLNSGSLAWVYMGHGRATELDHVRTQSGKESILSVVDVPNLRCQGHSPLAVLVACWTGAMDAPRDCLAEELMKADEGPVAVLAATRVTMPYGNTVLGCELLRACFRDRPEHMGEILQIAQRRTLAAPADDQLRASLDSIATVVSPKPIDLAGERGEHVLMYHLYGDPLLHLRRPPEALHDPAPGSEPGDGDKAALR